MKGFIPENDLNELIEAFEDNIHFLPETPSIRYPLIYSGPLQMTSSKSMECSLALMGEKIL